MQPQPHKLVLLVAGSVDQVGTLLAQAASPLASVLGRSLAAPLPSEHPSRSLALLHDSPNGEKSVLAPLPIDPGCSLADGSCWAEALGAWRQPAVLLLTTDQQNSGLPAAMVALLAQKRVPLAGLVQWGRPWLPELRRREGLPWLGALDDTALDGCGLPLALAMSCASLDVGVGC